MTAAETLIEIASVLDDLADADEPSASMATKLEASDEAFDRIDALIERWRVLGEDRK